RHLLGELQHVLERPRLAERLHESGALAPTDLLLELLVLGLEEALFRRPPADRDQVVVRKRLLDVVEGTLVHRLDRALQRGLRRHEDHRGLGVLLPHRREDLGARNARHLDVREDDVGWVPLQRLEPEPVACTALSTRFDTTRCNRSSSPSMGVASPVRSMTASSGQSGCSRTRRIAAAATVRRSSGRHSVARTREKSRNSESRRDNRSVSRTTNDVKNFSSAFTRFARPSCSTEERLDASGFLISCARLADSSATASCRSARRWSSSSRFESEISVKIAVTRGSPAGST